MPEKPEFIPTTNELCDAIAVLLIAFCPEIPREMRERIYARARQTIEAMQAEGQQREARIATALSEALRLPEWNP